MIAVAAETEAWVAREDAARIAGVHYNTIRAWELKNLIRRRRGDRRQVFVSREDVERMGERIRLQRELEEGGIDLTDEDKIIPFDPDIERRVSALETGMIEIRHEIWKMRGDLEQDA